MAEDLARPSDSRAQSARSRGSTLTAGIALLLVLGFIVSFIAARLDESAGDSTPAAIHAVGEDRVRVEVLNAAGRAGLAREATRVLRDSGFDVVFYGNADSFGLDSSSVAARLGDVAAAASVAQALGIEAVVDEPDSTRVLDVSVILGMDWTPPATRAESGGHSWFGRLWSAIGRRLGAAER